MSFAFCAQRCLLLGVLDPRPAHLQTSSTIDYPTQFGAGPVESDEEGEAVLREMELADAARARAHAPAGAAAPPVVAGVVATDGNRRGFDCNSATQPQLTGASAPRRRLELFQLPPSQAPVCRPLREPTQALGVALQASAAAPDRQSVRRRLLLQFQMAARHAPPVATASAEEAPQPDWWAEEDDSKQQMVFFVTFAALRARATARVPDTSPWHPDCPGQPSHTPRPLRGAASGSERKTRH